jgi:hypothetical protein
MAGRRIDDDLHTGWRLVEHLRLAAAEKPITTLCGRL